MTFQHSKSGSSASISRRTVLRGGLGMTAALATSSFGGRHVFAESKTKSELVTGEGEYTYRVKHHWPELPAPYRWQVTHNVAEDSSRNLYVIHEGEAKLKDHPSIFVFDSQGKFIRAFGQQFQGGGHGLEIRKEGNEEFVYVTAYQQVKSFAKLTLNGETVWEKRAPMECGQRKR